MIISGFTAFPYDTDEHRNDISISPVREVKKHG